MVIRAGYLNTSNRGINMDMQTAFARLIDTAIASAKTKQTPDLTGARFLHLSGRGRSNATIRVFNLESAIVVFQDYRDYNCFGASDLGTDCGKITDEDGQE